MLQHLLPPEAIQEIRQIWQEMNAHNNTNNNNDNKSDTDVPMTSSKSSSSNQSTVAATAAVCGGGGASPIYHHNSPSLRENFARRVRQVVRQYLGPKAFVADNFNEPQNTETDSSYMKTTKAATAGGGGGGDDNKSQQSLTFLSNNELHRE
ncbi:unnamed protein product [Trichobilharzia regenti]|nr:unnamed protein product [Trichobilharzia regenti]